MDNPDTGTPYLNRDGTVWEPAFPGQRPPFQPGNTIQPIDHGIYSPRTVDPIARQYIADVERDPSTAYLAQPRFAAALASWASARAKVQLLEEWVDSLRIDAAADSDRGKTSPLELLRKWTVRADNQAARLGLDPLSAARLGKDVAQGRQADAAAILTQLRTEHETDTPRGG